MKYLLFYIKISGFLFLASCAEISLNRDVIKDISDVEVIIDKEESDVEKTQKDIEKNITAEEKQRDKTTADDIKSTAESEGVLKKDSQIVDKKIDKDIIDAESNEELKDDYLNKDFKELIKIGLLVPLNGKNSFLGNTIFQSAEMSLFETKASNIELLPINSGSSIESAVQAAKILEDKGVSIIIGPIFSSQAIAVRKTVKKSIPILSFTNDESISRNGLWVFGFTPRQEINAIFKEMIYYKIQKLSVIIPNSAYGNLALENIKKESLSLNIQIKNIYKYVPSLDSFTDLGLELEKRVDKEIDALLILAGGKQLREISSRAQYRGINPKNTQYFGISSWNSTKILGEPSLLKGIFVAPEQSSFESFVSRYYKIYGVIPSEIGGLSYDILSLCNSAIKQSNNIESFTAFLTKPSGFNGVFGYFSLDKNGLLKRKFASYQVMKRSFVKK